MNLVRLIKMCLNETYNRVSVGKHMYDMVLISLYFMMMMLMYGVEVYKL